MYQLYSSSTPEPKSCSDFVVPDMTSANINHLLTSTSFYYKYGHWFGEGITGWVIKGNQLHIQYWPLCGSYSEIIFCFKKLKVVDTQTIPVTM